jgi:hypothetical protein
VAILSGDLINSWAIPSFEGGDAGRGRRNKATAGQEKKMGDWQNKPKARVNPGSRLRQIRLIAYLYIYIYIYI